MVRDHLLCLFAATPIADCARDVILPTQSLASTWPMALVFVPIIGIAVYAYLRAIYPFRIDWSRDQAPDWDVGADESPTIEIRARRAGE